jgi:hypothetical protein
MELLNILDYAKALNGTHRNEGSEDDEPKETNSSWPRSGIKLRRYHHLICSPKSSRLFIGIEIVV